MIEVKEAIQIARAKAAEMLGVENSAVEEIEKDVYHGSEVWSITLGVPRDFSHVPAVAKLSADPLSYKRFFIDAQTGEFLAMKIRELAA
jgi:hypothetical protein